MMLLLNSSPDANRSVKTNRLQNRFKKRMTNLLIITRAKLFYCSMVITHLRGNKHVSQACSLLISRNDEKHKPQ
jgi:hypothetical protein